MFNLTHRLAKAGLRLRPSSPPNAERPEGLQEVFRHPRYVRGDRDVQRRIRRESAQWKHADEIDHPWDDYFGVSLDGLIDGELVLDLGCFTGGRSVAWAERYGFDQLVGTDVSANFALAAKEFAAERGTRASFLVAIGERLPFPDAMFTAILSSDVLEHVQDIERVLQEAFRVLRPGGRFFVIFPSYFHPAEHHLGLATRLPGIHYFFSGATLVAAYADVLAERGADHTWYARSSPALAGWERGNTINGTTSRRFRKLVRDGGWKVVLRSTRPVLSVGRISARRPLVRAVASLAQPFSGLPILEEFLCHRIAYVLEKPR